MRLLLGFAGCASLCACQALSGLSGFALDDQASTVGAGAGGSGTGGAVTQPLASVSASDATATSGTGGAVGTGGGLPVKLVSFASAKAYPVGSAPAWIESGDLNNPTEPGSSTATEPFSRPSRRSSPPPLRRLPG